MEPTPIFWLLALAFLILSLGVHEAAHAWVANLCGDSTAKDEGRLTLNPIAHIDPFMTILLPIVLFYLIGMPFGGAKPVPVVARNLRSPLRDMMLVALAGPASNVLLAILFLTIQKFLVYVVGMEVSLLAPQVLYFSMYMNLLLALFNMLPIPPLDGSRVMAYILPASLRETYVSIERFGMLLIMGLVYFGATTAFLEPTIGMIGMSRDGRIFLPSDAPVLRWLDVLTGENW